MRRSASTYTTASVANLVLIACVAIAVWLVFVPVAALIYNAFTEDTGFGPGAFSFANFAEAYSGWHIARLLRNSLIFAGASAVLTLLMGAAVAWVVERTDAPGGSVFHTSRCWHSPFPACSWRWHGSSCSARTSVGAMPCSPRCLVRPKRRRTSIPCRAWPGRCPAIISRLPTLLSVRLCARSTCAWRRPG